MEKEIIINNKLAEIAKINQFIEETGMSLNLPAELTMRINLAIEEAIGNIIKYAYPQGQSGEIILRVSFAPEKLTFLIIDEGMPFDVALIERETQPTPEQPLTEGPGFFFIRRTMDTVDYTTADSQNHLTLTKKISDTFRPEDTLKINICRIEDITVLAIEGRLDTVNAHKFQTTILEILKEPVLNVIINCEGLTYISSSGLRSFILLQKNIVQRSGSLVMEAMKPEIRKIFDLTGCSSLFTIR